MRIGAVRGATFQIAYLLAVGGEARATAVTVHGCVDGTGARPACRRGWRTPSPAPPVEATAGVVPATSEGRYVHLGEWHERIVHLRWARDLMDLRFADPLDLDQLAAQAGFSKFHFARAFKDAYGETPANYLSRRRWSAPRICCVRPT